jgi:membrane dipeptidase
VNGEWKLGTSNPINALPTHPITKSPITQRPMLIVDAHQDLAWNMLTFGRDYTQSVITTRQRERGSEAPTHNGDTLLGWPEYQQGRVALVFATLFAAPARRKLGNWDSQSYRDEAEAHNKYSSQLDAYHRLADDHPGKFCLIQSQGDLNEIIAHWQTENEKGHPVGLVILMEGAEGMRSPSELETWWARGVRIIGPAWAGTRFCGGTHEPGPLTPEGYALLDVMAGLNFALDISHMDEKAVLQTLDSYPGTIIASHANAAVLLKGQESNRFLSDRVIQGLLERDGIIGVVPYNRFLVPGWTIQNGRQIVTLEHVVGQIDYICQIAGDARHVGIGSDFDGGFGLQSVPAEIDSIADLGKIGNMLTEKGFTEEEIAAVMSQNWLNFLTDQLPEGVS